ncbi:MAG: hypothetical protein JOS17DRAFT_9159 [Linnemannia elongata]|nr:MAG: hypothetical protein JOS17DRAFT_9159 [Linnemannia elongata]
MELDDVLLLLFLIFVCVVVCSFQEVLLVSSFWRAFRAVLRFYGPTCCLKEEQEEYGEEETCPLPTSLSSRRRNRRESTQRGFPSFLPQRVCCRWSCDTPFLCPVCPLVFTHSKTKIPMCTF